MLFTLGTSRRYISVFLFLLPPLPKRPSGETRSTDSVPTKVFRRPMRVQVTVRGGTESLETVEIIIDTISRERSVPETV